MLMLPLCLAASDSLRIGSGHSSISFTRQDGVYKVGPMELDGAPCVAPDKGALLMLDGEPLYVTRAEPFRQGSITGIRFSGQCDSRGARIDYEGRCYYDKSQPLDMLNWELGYAFDRDREAASCPRAVWSSMPGSGSPDAHIHYINALAPSSDPVLVNRGYPLIWTFFGSAAGKVGLLIYDDTQLSDGDGKYFVFDEEKEHVTFRLSSMDPNSDPGMKHYYWNYKHMPDMFPDIPFRYYPETTSFAAGDKHRLRFALYARRAEDIYAFEKQYLSPALDMAARPGSVSRSPGDWDSSGEAQLREFGDTDTENAGDRYVAGKGWYSAPVKDTMSHGPGNVVSTGSASVLAGLLYYARATENSQAYDFYLGRLKDIDFPGWASHGSEGFFNEFWTREAGYDIHWSSMWSIYDMGAWSLYNIAKLTGDKGVRQVFEGLMDYGRKYLLDANLSLGEHWNDKDRTWYRLTKETAFTVSEQVRGSHTEYPGTNSVFCLLSLLQYEETGGKDLFDSAAKQLERINGFLDRPSLFYTLCEIPKPNGFGFAAAANVKMYEITGNESYLDKAEDHVILLLLAYHLRDENGRETGFAHASYLGEFDYVCVSSLETMEPLYLACRLLRYRSVPALESMLVLADRRHLYAYGAHHPEKDALYKYIPLELIPQADSYAQYMGGPIMIENVMLHGLHSVSDDMVTAVCPDAAFFSGEVRIHRDMLLINKTGKKRSVSLSLKHLEQGRYMVTESGTSRVYSSEELEKGIGVTVPANSSLRLSVSKTEDS
ncbi:MAG: hypothetical protein IK083_01250 [Abditibacteriota bacterium]|nr:hypothetical protein [Abditibacteriota bacterium]